MNSPLVVFVHVPKAAGSSINRALQALGNGEDHIEKHRQNPEKFRKIAMRSDWISGHIPLRDYKSLLGGLPREVRYFSSIREPQEQVMSHYNWLMEIYHRGDIFYERHPAAIKKISKELREADHENPEEVIWLLQKHRQLFLNFQSLYLTGGRKEAHVDTFIEAPPFEKVVCSKRISDLIAELGLENTEIPHTNVSNYHFNPAVFENERVVRFLEQQNGSDLKLYQAIATQ